MHVCIFICIHSHEQKLSRTLKVLLVRSQREMRDIVFIARGKAILVIKW